MQVIFNHSELTAENIKTFYFKPERPVRYTAGQFIELTLPHDNADKRGVKRWFTLSSSPTEELLSITTKFAAENGSTFKQALATLEAGTVVRMSDPMGDFVLPKDKAMPLVFVAGGIGVTPMHSMIKFLYDSSESRPITLIYAANKQSELAFMELFKDSGVRVFTMLREDPGDGSSEVGLLDASKILELSGYQNDGQIYLSGPEPMVEGFTNDLKKQGVDKKRLVTDYFPGYTEL